MSGNYASSGLTIAYNGQKLSEGFRGATTSKNGDLVQVDFDLQGRQTVSTLANQGGTINITYTQTSDSLKKWDKMASGMQLVKEFFSVPYEGTLVMDDPLGHTANFVAINCVILNTGDESWGDAVGEREISLSAEKIIYTDNVADVIANLASYLGD